jgi:hypothetical protein
LQRSREAPILAQGLSQPFTQVFALNGIVHQMIRRIRNRASYSCSSLLRSGRFQPTMRTSCTKPTTVEAIRGKRPSASR